MPASNAEAAEIAHHRARLRRAGEHYERFARQWQTYLDSRPHRLVMETEADRARVRVVRDAPIPADLSLILSEFLYQLRAALDNCLYAVAVIDSGVAPPPNAAALEWPICVDAKAWERSA